MQITPVQGSHLSARELPILEGGPADMRPASGTKPNDKKNLLLGAFTERGEIQQFEDISL